MSVDEGIIKRIGREYRNGSARTVDVTNLDKLPEIQVTIEDGHFPQVNIIIVVASPDQINAGAIQEMIRSLRNSQL